MTQIVIIALYISITAMALLVLIKRWEVRSGKMIASPIRPATAKVAHATVVWLGGVLPGTVRVSVREFFHIFRDIGRLMTARVVLWLEYRLEKTLDFVRLRTTPSRHGGEPVSVFLREVAEYKKMLSRRKRRNKEE